MHRLLALRYALIALHTVFLILPMVISVTIIGSFVLLIIHCCAAFPWLIYIPYTTYISVRDKNSHFDHAGGEVAYVVIEMSVWIVSVIFAFIIRFTSIYCDEGVLPIHPINNYDLTRCTIHLLTGIFSLIQIIILSIWLYIIISSVYASQGRTHSQAFQVSTHKLMGSSWRETDELDLYEGGGGVEETGMIRPFTEGQRSLSMTARIGNGQDGQVAVLTDPRDPAPGYHDPYYTIPALEEQRLLALARDDSGTGSTMDSERRTGMAAKATGSSGDELTRTSQSSLARQLKHGFGEDGFPKVDE